MEEGDTQCNSEVVVIFVPTGSQALKLSVEPCMALLVGMVVVGKLLAGVAQARLEQFEAVQAKLEQVEVA